MSDVFDVYRTVHQQAFLPIFINDHFDSKTLVEACREAGCAAIEYTLRRPDSRQMIPWIRKNHPDLRLLVGSTLDSDRDVNNMRRRHPQLMTISELVDLGVDGFVLMVGWSPETIRRFSPDFVVAATAMTVTEALQQVDAGAHFIKTNGRDLGFIRRARGDATFELCPVLVTSGVTLARIEEVTAAGAITYASGFDLLLAGKPADVPKQDIVDAVKHYLAAAAEARATYWPDIAGPGADQETWLNSLPHAHPF